jgi:hypothetical protein
VCTHGDRLPVGAPATPSDDVTRAIDLNPLEARRLEARGNPSRAVGLVAGGRSDLGNRYLRFHQASLERCQRGVGGSEQVCHGLRIQPPD